MVKELNIFYLETFLVIWKWSKLLLIRPDKMKNLICQTWIFVISWLIEISLKTPIFFFKITPFLDLEKRKKFLFWMRITKNGGGDGR